MCTIARNTRETPEAHAAHCVIDIATVVAAERVGRPVPPEARQRARDEAKEVKSLIESGKVPATKEELDLLDAILA